MWEELAGKVGYRDQLDCLLTTPICKRSIAAQTMQRTATGLTHATTSVHWRIHRRQPRRGCRGRIPPIFWLVGTSMGMSPPIFGVAM